MKIKDCPFCNGSMKLQTTYDTEWVECTKCKLKSHTLVGDYYDEGFMCGQYIIPMWNKEVDYIKGLKERN